MKTKSRFWMCTLAITFIIPLFLSSCKKAEVNIPLVTTADVTSVTINSATCGGKVIDDGGAEVTARGVVWGKTTKPDINTHDGITNDGSGIGSFTSNLTSLLPETNYYVRAYATNRVGTAYGNELQFKTLHEIVYDSVTDINGNVYKTVTIGTQVWMAENLRVSKYNDGTPIPNVSDAVEWNNIENTGAYCWYNNDSAKYEKPYGKLYNWFTVGTGKLCPAGWHVPSDDEWQTLVDQLGGVDIAGGKLKEAGTTHWKSPNTAATNEVGFTALPGGFRKVDGTYLLVGEIGLWWTTKEHETNPGAWAYYRIMWSTDATAGPRYDFKTEGFSIRCVKN